MTFDDIPEIALDWHTQGKGAALASVIETWGSAPRPVGSLLAISGASDIAGSVSGGCVEGAVVAEALDAMQDGKPRILTYGVSDNDAFGVGLACGGTIRILVEPIGEALTPQMLADICAARKAREPIAYLVNTVSWERRLAKIGEIGPWLDARFVSDKSGFEGDVFANIQNPPLRMAVVGAVHIAQPLMVMAGLAGFDATLIDPREAFGSQERFPGQAISNEWPDEALDELGVDARTAVVTLAHDPKIDDPAIFAALNSDAFYVGCLGSNRTHAKRVERLTDAGFSVDQIARIEGPVGLAIGAKTPAEIAISIMAGVTKALRAR